MVNWPLPPKTSPTSWRKQRLFTAATVKIHAFEPGRSTRLLRPRFRKRRQRHQTQSARWCSLVGKQRRSPAKHVGNAARRRRHRLRTQARSELLYPRYRPPSGEPAPILGSVPADEPAPLRVTPITLAEPREDGSIVMYCNKVRRCDGRRIMMSISIS